MRLELPYPISINRMYRNFRGIMVMSKEGREYKEKCKHIALLNGIEKIEGEVKLEITLLPKLTKKGEASKVRIDLDNLCKATLDSMNGVLYEDDKQITKLVLQIGDPVLKGGLIIKVI